MGWAARRRDHGGLIFIDLRDREGLTQCIFDPAAGGSAHALAQSVRAEFVLAIRGTVAARPAGTENPKLDTGGIEVRVAEMKVLNDSRPLPFQIDAEGEAETDETLRLKYRYLDMRRPSVLQAFRTRDLVCRAVRDYLHEHDFLEVETPFLTRSTPEGARDFLVPSRLQPGSFYALPQSPQLFKQILMVAGFERYFQIVRCFRDEDLRRDRQPEFTQIDIETSFLDRDDFLPIVEGLVAEVWRQVKGVELTLPFPRLAYDEAMSRFGSDKPDLRFGMELVDVSPLFAGGEFQAFAQAVAGGGSRQGSAGARSRGNEPEGARRSHERCEAGGREGAGVGQGESGRDPIARWPGSSSPSPSRFSQTLGAGAGDLLLMVGDAPAVAATVLGRLRVDLAKRLGLIPTDRDVFAWVVDFPLVEWNEDEKRWDAVHHPFTAPRDEDVPLLETDPGPGQGEGLRPRPERSGGGGRLDPHPSTSVQERVFGLIGIGKEEARARFGFLLDALEFGAPPMGGIAFGLDRLAAVLVGRGVDPRGDRLPEDAEGHLPAHGCAGAGGRQAAPRTWGSGRGRRRPGPS